MADQLQLIGAFIFNLKIGCDNYSKTVRSTFFCRVHYLLSYLPKHRSIFGVQWPSDKLLDSGAIVYWDIKPPIQSLHHLGLPIIWDPGLHSIYQNKTNRKTKTTNNNNKKYIFLETSSYLIF